MTPETQRTSGDQTSVRPFQVNIPEVELTDLRKRIHATRFPERETVMDFSQGVPLATNQKLARYWGIHVVIPSMPGYGFSGKPTTTGWNPQRIARAWDVLMKLYVQNDPVNNFDPDGLAEHRTNTNPANLPRHEKGEARKNRDKFGGEKGRR